MAYAPPAHRLAASVLKCGKRKVWMDPNEASEISMANSRAWRSRGRVADAPRESRSRAARRRPAAAPRQPPSLARVTARRRALNRLTRPASLLRATYMPSLTAAPLVASVAAAAARVPAGQNVRKLIKDGFIIRKPVIVHSRSRAQRRNERKSKGRHTGHGKRRGTANARLPFKVLWVRRQRVLRRLLRKYREAKKIDCHMYHELYMQAKGNVFKNKRVLIETIHRKKNVAVQERQRTEQIEARKAKAAAKSTRKAGKAEATA